MCYLLEELDLKFKNIETKIEFKIKHINNFYIDEIELLYQKFNANKLAEKFSNELNNQREELLNQLKINIGLEIDHANEILAKSEYKNIEQILADESNKMKKIKFKSNIIKPNRLFILKLLSNEFKFGKQFSISQLIKYHHILGLTEYIINDTEGSKRLLNDTKSLCLASKNASLEIIKFLVESGANLNATGEKEETPFLEATSSGQLKLVKYFIENGVDVNEKDTYGNTSLMLASKKNNLELIKYLVENGADVNANNDWNNTALVYATFYSQLENIKYLFENGAGTKAVDKNRAFLFACEKGPIEIVKYFVGKGADVNAQVEDHQASLVLAFYYSGLEMMNYLIEIGADVNTRDRDG